MEPTVKSGEVVTIDLSAYRKTDPKRWEVVMFPSPYDGDSNWISRVVGLPGETVDVRDDGFYIDGKKVTAPAPLALGNYRPMEGSIPPSPRGAVSFPYVIPPDGYFFLGDNVENALDGRYWGALQLHEIRGKVLGK